ncbi:MAG: glutamine--fructose-6-phosphate transaminase (isomerizing) [Clostridia bacterium]|nr:glutamine--fructose-6-phosphate transaminase (isomerizing) [Clostridia bacterium]
MCGIVGYVGKNNAVPVILSGLYKLEYRGYDSAGIAVIENEALKVIKTKGRIKDLDAKIQSYGEINTNCAIGHTRWATHGAPSDVNSHPHISKNGRIAIVHNGIIENFLELREMLEAKGFEFVSQTDTEVVAHLFELNYKGNALEALQNTTKQLRGSYAIGVVTADAPSEIVCARKDNPLIIGIGEGENILGSDIPAIIGTTKNYIILNDNETARVTAAGVDVYNALGDSVSKEIHVVDWDISAAEKGGYEHFMMKEICEQAKAVKDTLSPRITKLLPNMSETNLTPEMFKNVRNIHIVACGSALYAGLVGKHIIEKLARIPCLANVASEFRYNDPIIDENDLCIVVSQSGETADTLAAMREAKKRGAKTLAIVNVVGSSAAREADSVLYTWAGPEIAVATTKAYSAQLSAMYLVAVYAAMSKGILTEEMAMGYCKEIMDLPELIDEVIKTREQVQYLASIYSNRSSTFFIGRGIDYAAAQEASLKLKEISYVHSEAYAAGELKHGTISLIEDGTLVVALANDDDVYEKTLSNIKSVKARGANVILVTNKNVVADPEICDHVIKIPKTIAELSASLSIVPMQLLAYYIGVYRGCDIDMPRNLAKSVTVE